MRFPRVLSVLLSAAAMAGATEPSAPSLKTAYADQFLIGTALAAPPLKVYRPAARALIAAQFNAATPENCLKPQALQPREHEWHFADGDAFVDFCAANKLAIFGHTLVWHSSAPAWMFQDGDKPASREVVLARMRDYIHTVVGRYRGRIRGWDVVNEAISDRPGEFLRDSPWRAQVGDDFIEQAFRFAHEADPKAELQYNDYGIERPEKRARTLELIRRLHAAGVPIASVGIQGHWVLDQVPFQDIEESIKAFAAAGVKVAITELDLDVVPRAATGADAAAREADRAKAMAPAPCPPEKLQRQAGQYAQLFQLFHRYRDQIERVTFWGLDDGSSWLNYWPSRRYNHPLLWDRELKPKPAFDAVIAAAHQP